MTWGSLKMPLNLSKMQLALKKGDITEPSIASVWHCLREEPWKPSLVHLWLCHWHLEWNRPPRWNHHAQTYTSKAHLLRLAKQEVMEMRVTIFHRLKLQSGKLRNQDNHISSLHTNSEWVAATFSLLKRLEISPRFGAVLLTSLPGLGIRMRTKEPRSQKLWS